jgi:signal transduction histidine kinase
MYFSKLTKLGIPVRGLRARLTFVYSTLFGLVICLFSFVIIRQNIISSRQQFDSALLNYAIDLSSQIHYDAERFSFSLNRIELKKEFPFTVDRTFYMVRSIDGKILARGGSELFRHDIPYDPTLPLKDDYTHRYFDHEYNGIAFRVVNMKVSNEKGMAIILQVLTPARTIRERQKTFIAISIVVIPLLIFFASIISFYIAGKAMYPVELLTNTAREAATNLSLRVPEINTGDEIWELSHNFNTLLERLEKAFKAQEDFVANASHQLYTPLAIIKGELDVLETKERSLEDHEKFRRSLREELERLIKLVDVMLLVSRVESGQGNFVFAPVRIDELLLNSSSRMSAKAQEKKITVRFNMSENIDSQYLTINGEKELLYCLFDNLLDNAIKYSPPETAVSIDIGEDNDAIIVEIKDEGPGIPEEELKTILSHRFHRGNNLIPGTGIGLSIVSQIAAYHHASIDYRINPPQGSIFRLRFPIQQLQNQSPA